VNKTAAVLLNNSEHTVANIITSQV